MITPVSLVIVNVGKKLASGEEPSPAMVASALVGWSAAGSVAQAKDTTVQSAVSSLAQPKDAAQLTTVSGAAAKSNTIVFNDKTVYQESVSKSPTSSKQITIAEQHVADQRYADYGNLVDCWNRISSGEIPELDEVFRALIDILDASTFGLFSKNLLSYKLEPHLQQRFAKIEADREIQTSTVSKDHELSKDVVYKEGSEGETISVETLSKRVEQEKETTIVTQETETIYEAGSKIDIAGLSSDDIHSQVNGLNIADTDSNMIIQNMKINNTYDIIEETGRETSVVCDIDIGKFLGRNHLYTNADATTGIESADFAEYKVSNIDGLPYNIFAEEFPHGGIGVEKLREEHFESSINIDAASDSTHRFEEGAVQYVPVVGSFANVAAKIDYGVQITAMDTFWMALDAGTIITLGTLTPLTSGVKASATFAVKSATKTVAKETIEQTAKTTVESIGKEGIKATGEKAIKRGTANVAAKTVSETEEIAQKTIGKDIGKTGVDDIIKSSAKEGADVTIDETAKNITGKGIELASKQPSQILGDNLVKKGLPKLDGHAAHHIVPHEDMRAAPARNRLKSFNIDINSPENGIWLPANKAANETSKAAYHRTLHTNKYYTNVNRRLMQAHNKEESLEVLDDISKQLAKNKFPH